MLLSFFKRRRRRRRQHVHNKDHQLVRVNFDGRERGQEKNKQREKSAAR
jgi:hypothetical protein